jgi:eukaryotic-like serine/threonine-protein kinase
MTLAPGTRLGPYEVLALAGAGGMGEVYRARDTRLGRDVALKVLPERFAADEELRWRFEREARAVSALSHPSICPLYDVGRHEGLDFLVMEFLEGETLATRLKRGPLPLAQVLGYATDIADALAAAHAGGIVHRDLKPGNVMLTRTGARLLDFGLARPSGPAVNATPEDLTTAAPVTARGTILGTFQYMSPEQVEGRDADARSDIFSFGAVLYEMATGQRAFDGKTTTSVVAAILERDPAPVSALQPLAPAAFDDVVRGCLAKAPDERWQTAHDVKLQLQAIRRRLGEAAANVVPAGPGQAVRGPLLAWAVTGVALALAAVFATLALRGGGTAPTAAVPVVRAAILPPAAHSFTPNDFAVSPDGERVAFVAAGADGVSSLWVRAIDSPQPAEISGSEGASSPFWSPDSRRVAFFAGGRLLRVEPGGKGVAVICEATRLAKGGAWNADDVILFSNMVFGPLWRVTATGGTAVPATSVPDDMPGEAHRYPQFLPDGRRFLFTVSWTHEQRGGLYLASLDGGLSELVSPNIRSRVVLANDRILFVDGGTVFAQRLDTEPARLVGDPEPLLRNEIATDWRFQDMPVSASQTGLLVYRSAQTYQTQLAWFDRDGRELGVVGAPGSAAPAFAPDGRRLAVTLDGRGTGRQNIWIHDLQRGIPTQLTDTGIDTALAWAGSTGWVVYSSIRETNGIYRRRADGAGQEEQLLESVAHLLVTSSAADGRRVMYMGFGAGTPGLRILDVETRESTVLETGAEGVFSPDGRWIALTQVTGGVVARSIEGGVRVQLSRGPGAQARWRADMREIFYIAPDKKLMAVPVAVGNGTLEIGAPAPLFQTRIVEASFVLFQYDVTDDGQRFLINSLPREDAAAPLTLLVNWTGELGR